jgi:hypothetical protein
MKMTEEIKRKRKTGEDVIVELVNRKRKFPEGGSVEQKDLPAGERDFEPADHIIKARDKPIIKGQAAMDDFIAKRTLVGLEYVASAKNFELSQEEPLGDQEQKGRHRKAVFMIKRSISGDKIKRNLLYVHSTKELIDTVVAFDTDDAVESGSVTYFRKEVTVHAAGILKRIAFICKTVGTGGTTFAYRVLNIANTPANREVKNFIYQNTGNGVPTADSFPVDRTGDYPYVNKDVPIDNKVVVEIEVNAVSITNWEWEAIISSEERATDIPTTE